MAENRDGVNQRETRQNVIDQNSPEILTNPIIHLDFERANWKINESRILIGTNNLVDRIGILQDVGASYILLRSFENDSLVYCDIYSIKFITISTTGIYGGNNNRYHYY